MSATTAADSMIADLRVSLGATVPELEAVANKLGLTMRYEYRTHGGYGRMTLTDPTEGHVYTGETNPAYPKASEPAYRIALESAVMAALGHRRARA